MATINTKTPDKNSGYTPLNMTANRYLPNLGNYEKEVRKEIEWLKQNPGVTDPNGYKNLGITGQTVPEGYFTTDKADVSAAMQAGKAVYAAEHNGVKGYTVSGVERPRQEGASGADEAWMSDKDYNYLTGLKSQWQKLEEEKAAATPERLAEIQQEQDALHAKAETVRYGYGYVGGADGSMYIPAAHLEEGGLDRLMGYGSSAGNGSAGSGASTGVTVPQLPSFAVPEQSGYTDASVPAVPDVEIADYSQYIEQLQNAQLEAALAEYETAYQKNVNAIDRAGAGVEETYRNARNQTAGAADLASRNFAELANASGLNSGTGGQAALARGVAMQNDMNTLNLQQAQSVADLELQRADNDAWYQGAIAAAKAEGDAQKAQLLYQEKIRVESATVEAIQQKFDNEIMAYRARMDAAQQQFDNEVTRMKLEYEQLRDSVADARWQQEFDLAYAKWLQQVDDQQSEMEFERQRWEQEVALQLAKLDMQKQTLEMELEKFEMEREEWEREMALGWGVDSVSGGAGIGGTGPSSAITNGIR